MDLVTDQKNWIFLSRILTLIEESLRLIFRDTWKDITGVDWVEKDQGQVENLKAKLGKLFKEIGKIEKDYVNSGEVYKWDLLTLAKILRSEDLKKDTKFRENLNVAVRIRNFFSHHHNKNIPNEEFDLKWSEIKSSAIELGVSELLINLIEKDIENKTNSTEHKYGQLKSDGDLHLKKGDFEDAIKVYTKALLLPELSDNKKGILYEKRCESYMKYNESKKCQNVINLALSDSENSVKYCENWAKAHLRLGQVQVLLKNYEKALVSFKKGLEFEPKNSEIKEALDSCKLEWNDYLANSELDPYFNQSVKRIAERNIEITGGVLSEESERVSNYTRSAIESTSTSTYSELLRGHAYRDGDHVPQSYEMAANFYKKASLDGDLEAKYQLALLYMKGQGVVKNLSKGMEMLKIIANDTKAPKQFNGDVAIGIKEAQYSLGMSYLEGIVVEKSIDMAIKWFKISAENGCGPAAYKLGAIYGEGKVMERDEEKSLQYLELAASNHTPNPNAMQQIAFYYLRKKDSKMAKLWWERGVQHGNMDENTKISQKEFEQKLKDIDDENGNTQNNELVSTIENQAGLDNKAYKLAINHPERKMKIIAHREYSKKNEMLQKEFPFGYPCTSINFESSKTQTCPESPQDLMFITLKDMDPTRDRIYEGFKIQLRIIDNPIVSLRSEAIYLVVQDEDLQTQNVSIYNYDIIPNYMSMDKKLGFGCTIVLMNPYMKMSIQSKCSLRVDEPATIIFLEEIDQVLCRFCIRPNTTKCCTICKVNYCSRACQTKDWKQGHKIICESNEPIIFNP